MNKFYLLPNHLVLPLHLSFRANSKFSSLVRFYNSIYLFLYPLHLYIQALHWAAAEGHVMVVQVLLNSAVDVFKKSCDGSLAADIAYIKGNERVCW